MNKPSRALLADDLQTIRYCSTCDRSEATWRWSAWTEAKYETTMERTIDSGTTWGTNLQHADERDQQHQPRLMKNILAWRQRSQSLFNFLCKAECSSGSISALTSERSPSAFLSISAMYSAELEGTSGSFALGRETASQNRATAAPGSSYL